MNDPSIPLIDLSVVNGKTEDEGGGIRKNSMMTVEGKMRKLSRCSHQTSMDNEGVKTVRTNELHESVSRGDLAKVEKIIREDPFAVNYVDKTQMTALHYACRYVNADVVKLLLKNMANPNAEDNDKWRPLHYAAKYEKKDLGRESADIDEDEIEPSRKETKEIITALCTSKAEVNAHDVYNWTALHSAAMKGNTEAALCLLKWGADPNNVDSNSMTPFMIACSHGSIGVFTALFDFTQKMTLDRRKNSALHIASQHGHIELVKRLLSWVKDGRNDEDNKRELIRLTNNEGKSALQLAVEGGNGEVVEELLKHYEKGQFNEREQGLLHLAARKGYLEIAKTLIEKAGMNVNEEDDQGRLPIHEAAKQNHVEVVEYLLQIEPSAIEKTDDLGFTPLLTASTTDAIDVVQVLLERRARFRVADRAGRNIIFLSAKYQSLRVLKHILDHLDARRQKTPPNPNRPRFKAKPTLRDEASRTVDLKRMMIDKVDQGQETAFHCVCGNGYLETVQLLYGHGARIDVLNEDGETPMHLAAENGRTNVVKQLMEWDKRLCMATDDQGRTPLHLAARQGHEETTCVLAGAESDLQAKNIYDETALDAAVKAGQLGTMKILIDQGASPMPTDDNGIATPLHEAAKEGYDLLVRHLLSIGVEVDRRDENGKTPLDLAIDNDHKSVALLLVHHKDWRKLLTPHGHIALPGLDKPRDTPTRQLIRKFPEVARVVFDNCMTTENTNEYFFNRHIYEFIDDTWLKLSEDKKSLCCDVSAYDINDRLLPDTRPYSPSFDLIYKNHPLRIMVNSERVSLLSHPLVISLLKHKWNTMGRYLYYSALTVYILFITLFTVFIAEAPAPFNLYEETTEKFINFEEMMKNETLCFLFAQEKSRPTVLAFCRYAVIVLSVLQIMKELFQLYHRKIAYFTMENGLECFIYVSGFLVVYDFQSCSAVTGIREAWQWNLAAASSFLQWTNLLLLVRKLPKFGIYIVMFGDILRTFARFSLIFMLFVIAFSISFFIVLQNRPEFSNLPTSIMKTTVMMIGEFEFTSIFHGNESDHNEKIFAAQIAYPLFLLFSIVMTILLMNLLVGLAVDDIKAVQEKAALKRLSMQVDLVLQVECSILGFIRRKCAKGARSYYPTQRNWWQRFRSLWGSSDNHDKNGDWPEEERNEEEAIIEEALKENKAAIDRLQTNIDEMYSKQLEMENLLKRFLDEIDIKGRRENIRDQALLERRETVD